MIRSFADKATEDIYHGTNTKEARHRLPRQLWRITQRKLSMLDAATDIKHLTNPPGNHLEGLVGDRAGYWSIRINEKYRIAFAWAQSDAMDVEIVDYH